jgi:hypothetical protein
VSITTASGAFYNYMKANTIITSVFYIEADGKTKQPYLTIAQTDDPSNNTFLCEDNQGETRFLISIFQSSYTKGINNRQSLSEYIKLLRGQVKNSFTFWDVTIENSWDSEKNIDNLYSFNMEILLKWNK